MICKMRISKVKFITSSSSFNETKKVEKRPEYAFIGRSNVGKSSLINMLTNTSLAKTSSTPGKTQLINHYLVNDSWFLVDLPGYGYAKTSKQKREYFKKFSEEYLISSMQLRCIFVLIDIRIQPQKNDIEFMNWLGKNNLPFIRLFSKIDKLNKHKIEKSIQLQNTELLNYWTTPPPYILTSSKEKKGKEEILNEILQLNSLK
jgi:GTP-binding protein